MPMYVIERNIPQAGAMSPTERQAGARTSCEVLATLAPKVQWQHSYFADDKVFCVYIADDEALVREHAQRSGFPADAIHTVRAVVDPTATEG